MEKSALIIGASGLVGSNLLQKLLQNPMYKTVTVLLRKDIPVNHSKLNKVVVDFDVLERWQEQFFVDDVFCCLGTTMKKAGSKEAFQKVDLNYVVKAATIAFEKNVSQFLVISSMGADSTSPFFYNRVKGTLENTLKTYSFKGLHIFRPSLLLGDRTEFRFGEKAAEWVSRKVTFLFTGRLRKFKSINADKVAEGMLIVALQNKKGVHVYESQEIERMSSIGLGS